MGIIRYILYTGRFKIYGDMCNEEHALSEKQKEHMWLYTGR